MIRLLALSLLLSGCFTSFGPEGFRVGGERYVNIQYGYLGYEDLRRDLFGCTMDGQSNEVAVECLKARGWRAFKK